MKHFRFLLLSLLAVGALLGCSRDGTGPAQPTIEGTYTLQTIDGRAMPLVMWEDSQERLELLSGSVTLRADGTWSDTHDVRFTDKATTVAETEAFDDRGTYTVTTGNVRLVSVDGSVYQAVWSGDLIIVAISGSQWTYRR
jgi:hypothetical protein